MKEQTIEERVLNYPKDKRIQIYSLRERLIHHHEIAPELENNYFSTNFNYTSYSGYSNHDVTYNELTKKVVEEIKVRTKIGEENNPTGHIIEKKKYDELMKIKSFDIKRYTNVFCDRIVIWNLDDNIDSLKFWLNNAKDSYGGDNKEKEQSALYQSEAIIIIYKEIDFRKYLEMAEKLWYKKNK